MRKGPKREEVLYWIVHCTAKYEISTVNSSFQYFDYNSSSEWRCCTVYKSVISKLCNEKLRGKARLIGHLRMWKGTLNSWKISQQEFKATRLLRGYYSRRGRGGALYNDRPPETLHRQIVRGQEMLGISQRLNISEGRTQNFAKAVAWLRSKYI